MHPEKNIEEAQNFLIAQIQQLIDNGELIPSCQFHGRKFIQESDHGEFCHECVADGGTGELSEIAADSTGFDWMEKIVKILNKPQ